MNNRMIFLILTLFLYACKDNPANVSPSSQSITANERSAALSSYVNSHHEGLRLLYLLTDTIGTDGKATKWLYCYVDTSAGQHLTYYFHATMAEITFDSTTLPLIGPGIITLRWFDSDSAMIFAESVRRITV